MKVKPILAAMLLATAIPVSNVAAGNNINIVINNNYVSSSTAPFISNGTTYVPVRVISEYLGFQVQWKSDSKTIIVIKDKITVGMQINNPCVVKYDSTTQQYTDFQYQYGPTIINGTTFVPLRNVAEAFNAQVNWNSNTKTVSINTATGGTSNITTNNPQNLNSVDTSAYDNEIADKIRAEYAKVPSKPNKTFFYSGTGFSSWSCNLGEHFQSLSNLKVVHRYLAYSKNSSSAIRNRLYTIYEFTVNYSDGKSSIPLYVMFESTNVSVNNGVLSIPSVISARAEYKSDTLTNAVKAYQDNFVIVDCPTSNITVSNVLN
jgi:hypothetical protein